VIRAGLAYCGIVLGTGIVLGAFRVPFVVPRIGVRAAELLEMPLMFVAILLSARFVVRRFALPPNPPVRLATGGLALALMIAAELGLSVVLTGQSAAAYIAGRDPVSGSVYLAMLVVFALMPLLVRRSATLSGA
jgi:hypothetical protein